MEKELAITSIRMAEASPRWRREVESDSWDRVRG